MKAVVVGDFTTVMRLGSKISDGCVSKERSFPVGHMVIVGVMTV